MVFLKFLCTVIAVMASLLYINNIIVDIGSAIASSRTLSPTGADDSDMAVKYAKFRMFLSFIIGISLGILSWF